MLDKDEKPQADTTSCMFHKSPAPGIGGLFRSPTPGLTLMVSIVLLTSMIPYTKTIIETDMTGLRA